MRTMETGSGAWACERSKPRVATRTSPCKVTYVCG